jgi:hypothetical protein
MTRRAHLLATVTLSLVISASGTTRAGSPPPTAFDGPETVVTTEGHTTLSWDAQSDGGTTWLYQLQESDESSFDVDLKLRYEGRDRASFVSGLPQGTTWFRVRTVTEDGAVGPWSDPIRVEVEYPERSRVLRFMALGAVVFLATFAAVVLGHRGHRNRTL